MAFEYFRIKIEYLRFVYINIYVYHVVNDNFSIPMP